MGKKKPTVLELCAGAGGQALGFEAAGFSHVVLVDNDPHSCATLRMNRPYWNVFQGDIHQFDGHAWQGVDVVAAGLPCPPFSIAGQLLGAKDDRNLFPALLRIVEQAQPRAVVVENVKGLLLKRFNAFRFQIERALSYLGFACHWQLLNAVNYGAPQYRSRFFLVAVQEGKPFSWPNPCSHGLTVGEALKDMMAVNGWKKADEWAWKADRPAPTIVGGSHKHGGPDLGPTRARREWARMGVDGLGIADNPPSPDFEGLPRLTIPMTAKLQTFPDQWVLSGGKTHRYRQIGNALPVALSTAIAKQVAKCLASQDQRQK